MFRNMNTRFEQFLAAENISQSQFADTIKVARASVSHILAGRNKPGWDFLYSMSKHYPNLNIEWLLNGTGKMYKSMNVPAPEPVRQEETLPPDLFSQLEPPAAEVKPQVTPRESEIRPESVRALADTLPTNGNDSPSEPMQVIDNKRKIAKIVVFYDDNTFIEIK